MLPLVRGLVGGCVKVACRTHRTALGSATPRFWRGEVTQAGLATSSYSSIPEQQDIALKQQEQQDVETQHQEVEPQDLPVLLQNATFNNSLMNAYKGLHTLSDWVSNKKLDFKKDVEGDAQFDKLIGVIDRGVIRSNPVTLLAALKSLLTLGVDSHSHVVQSIQMQLHWNLRKLSFPVLLSVMVLQRDHQHTDLQTKVFKACIDGIQRRWVEVRGAGNLETLYTYHTHFSAEFLGQLDDRATELAGTMTYTELAKVLSVLGAIKRRATPVMRALAFHMAKQSDHLSPTQLKNIIFAMNSLSFPDPVLMEKIANDLVPQVEEVDNPKLIGTILFCMGQLRWRHTGLLEAFCGWTEKNVAACPLANLSALIMTLAIVGYEPSNADALFSAMTSRLTPSSLFKKTTWLDVVWALSVLGRASNEHISSVLDPSFVSVVTPIEQHLRLGVRLKLLNVNAVTRLKHSYSGPELNLMDFKDVIITASKDDRKMSQHVLTMLHNLLPPPKYIRQCIQTSMGIYVNAEFVTDGNAKPLPIQDFSTDFSQKLSSDSDSSQSMPGKELPEGATKLTLLVWNYKDYTVGAQELTGINKLGIELLKKEGYKVVQIPFYEYNMNGKTLKNVQYLEGKIKEALKV